MLYADELSLRKCQLSG